VSARRSLAGDARRRRGVADRRRDNPEAAALIEPVRAWYAGRGWTPFAFQEDTWAAYLAGESGLIHAATGTGKSYAAWLGPVTEWLAENGRAAADRRSPIAPARVAEPGPSLGLRVLWITPLRALANDLVDALRAPLAALGVPWTVETRTGDTPAAVRTRQRRRLPAALITTPESLSILLSYPDAGEKLGALRCVVVDEWHELLASKRGVQVELALARLRSWNPVLRTWGLSATLGNLAEAKDVLLAGRPGVIVSGDLPKEYAIETIIPAETRRFPWAGHLGLRLLPEVLDAIEGARSTLLFCNVRSAAEAWYRAIVTLRPDWSDVTAIHHGSIDRTERESVEQRLRAGELRCVVCTSSLDLGVDFTPVDQVLQVGSPKGIARLLQRAGRSGHRPGATSRVLGVPTHAFELVEFAGARSALDRREVEARPPLDRPLDVLVQHLVTIALGGGFAADALRAEVRDTHAYGALSEDEWQWCLDFVSRGGPALRAYPQYARLVGQDGHWTVASRSLARLHRLAIGTITADPVLELRYLRGKRLGTIEESFIARLRPGERFVFAGRLLALVRVRDMTAYVRAAKGARGQFPRWYGGKLSFSTQLGDAVRRKLDEARRGLYADAEMRAVRPLLELQKTWSLLPAPDELLLETLRTRDGWHLFVFPFEGRVAHEGIGALLAWRFARAEPRSITVTANDYGFELLSAQPLEPTPAEWVRIASADGLLDDLLAALNAAELDRRQFREIARVAGLVFPGYPGMPKSARQLQASSSLFFDVFTRHDPGNLLLDQARREVLDRQLEITRLSRALERMARLEPRLAATERMSPLAFPLWADRMQAQHVSTERWSERVKRMAARLERAADDVAAAGRRS
jgi:ATP-dependent helicase Lhr and Lhr-like helicase